MRWICAALAALFLNSPAQAEDLSGFYDWAGKVTIGIGWSQIEEEHLKVLVNENWDVDEVPEAYRRWLPSYAVCTITPNMLSQPGSWAHVTLYDGHAKPRNVRASWVAKNSCDKVLANIRGEIMVAMQPKPGFDFYEWVGRTLIETTAPRKDASIPWHPSVIVDVRKKEWEEYPLGQIWLPMYVGCTKHENDLKRLDGLYMRLFVEGIDSGALYLITASICPLALELIERNTK